MTTTLPLFWHLSSASKKERIDASVKLVGALEQFQAQFVPKEPSESSEDEEEGQSNPDGLDALNAQDVSYSIRRLVRGLASPRESSRLGFAVALTELLSRLRTVSCCQIVSLIKDASKTQGSMTGQEERDNLFAQLFGLTAVIQSGLLVRTEPLPASGSADTSASTLASFEETITLLIALGNKKSWLRESVWWTICLSLDSLHESQVTWKKEAVSVAIERIFGEATWSPEKVAATLKLQTQYPKQEWGTILLPFFKNPDLLSASNLTALARILKESTAEDDEEKDIPKSAAGAWKPQLHFVWDIILDRILPGPNSPDPPSQGSFQEFFRVVVDESLFSSTSSAERKYWGFQVFQKALPRVSTAEVPMLFTKNFMRSWINNLSQNDRYLHKIAKQVVTEMQNIVKKNPALGFPLIIQLTGVNGNRQFDRITKTKTVESVLSSTDIGGIKNYITHLLEQVNDPADVEQIDVTATNSRRSWIIDQFSNLIHNGSIPKDDEWIQSVLDWLVVHGLFIVKKKSGKSPYQALHSVPHPAFSEQLRQQCRSRLLTSLATLTAQTTLVKLGDKTSKIPAVASDGEFWVSRVLSTIQQLEGDSKHVALLTEIDEEDQALRTKAQEITSNLKKRASGTPEEAARGTELLLSATLVQLYCSEEQEEANTQSLESCLESASRMFPEGKKGKKSRKSTGDASAEETTTEPVDVLVDTIIGFLEKSTAYIRTVGNQVFALLSGSVKESTVDLLLAQLERRDPAELADEDDDEDEDMEADEDADDDESEESGSVDDDDDDGADSNDEEADLELRKKIEEALRVNGIEEATGDDSDSEEELMDDDQMLALDEQLAAVFKSRANEKKPGKDVDAQREATHFKNRVLDLVDTFIKKQPTSPFIIRLIIPLFEVIAGTGSDERQLADKTKGLLTSRIGKLKEVPSSVDTDQATEVLDSLHLRARKVHSPETLSALSHCSLYLTKVLLHSQALDIVLQAYRQSLNDFLTRKNSALHTNFFQDLIRHYPAVGWELRDDLVTLSKGAINVYRRCQAFQLLHALLSQLPSIEGQQQEITMFLPSLRDALHEFISSGCEDKVVLPAPQVKELFKLGLLAVRQTKRIASDPLDLAAVWKPAIWRDLRDKLAASERFASSTALHTMCQQMALTSDANKSVKPEKREAKGAAAAKRKADTVSEAEGEPAVSKKTVRKKVKKDKV